MPDPIETPVETEVTYSAESQQAAIDAAVAAALTTNNAVRDKNEQGLVQNRDSLLEEGRNLKNKLQQNADDQRLLETDAATLRTEIEARLKGEYSEQLAEKQTALDNLQNTMNNKTMNGALDAAINDLKVKSTLRNALKAELLTENKITLADDGTVKIGDQDINTFMTEWSKTDKSKDFILAEPSAGGGSNGSGLNTTHTGKIDLHKTSGTDLFARARESQ